MGRWQRILVGLCGAVAVVAVGAVLAFQLGLRQLQSVVIDALGPRAEVASVTVDLSGLELRGLRVRAERTGPGAWPADDELRADRVRVRPNWRALWHREGSVWRVAQVEADGVYVSVLRTRQGRLRLLPALLERPGSPAAVAASASAASGPPAVALLIGKVQVRNAAVDFHDASVARPAHRLQLVDLQADVGPLRLPALDEAVPLRVEGTLSGREQAGAPRRDGRILLEGRVTPATRDAQLKATLRGIDLRALQPYLLKVNEGGVERGLLDLDLDATVQAMRLRAPGRVVLDGLVLGRGASFAGVPQQLVVAAMRRDGRIELKFTLEGRLDDPAFSLNESLATRVAAGLAESLGVSISGVVEGLGSVIKGLFGR